MSTRSDSERFEYQKVVYADTQVLVNELGIREAATLDAAERLFTDVRIAEGLPTECVEPTYSAFKAIHHHLFQDLYSWAGKERKYTTGRGQAPCAVPEQIGPWMERQFQILRTTDQLCGLAPFAFADQAAALVNEINAAHPFIEGNGRVQRIWLAGVAERAGYEFSIRPEDRDPWYAASKIGFEQADPTPMAALILSRIQILDDAERSKHDDRAAQFLDLSREQGLASQDASFKAAWLNIEKVETIAKSAMPHDPDGQQAIVAKAREQLADHIRAGASIAELTEQQAWRNTLGREKAGQVDDPDQQG